MTHAPEASRRRATCELSLVVPMYNEADACDALFAAVVPVLEGCAASFEIVCVDDGSTDDTLERVREHRAECSSIRVVSLARNFGKEAAMTAGIDIASGRAVVVMDADLQDPPELIADMVDAWRGGAKVVLARRVDRSSDSPLKRLTSLLFYVIFEKLAKPAIPRNVGDFRLIDRDVAEALKRLPERSRFMKGLFAWVGFPQATIEYVRRPRASGRTKFDYRKLWNFALDGILSFSALPLKVWSYCGLLLSAGAAVYLCFIVVRTLLFGVDVPGYASLMSVSLFFNGVVLISLGVLGEYVSRIFVEVKQRPIYIISALEGFDDTADAARGDDRIDPSDVAAQ